MRRIEDLVKKYNAGKCTAEEKKWLEQWYQSFEWGDKAAANFGKYSGDAKHEVWLAIQKNTMDFNNETNEPQNSNISYPVKWWKYVAAATVFIALGGLIIYFLRQPLKENDTSKEVVFRQEESKSILPGTSKAQLVLGDGTVISLDSARNMQLQEKDGTQIDKQPGKLVYSDTATAAGSVLFNTLSTPRGGEYQLVLPDGSKVWLNAASAIKFPTRFEGKERTVFLQGEAYFEVAKNNGKPFQVKLGNDMAVHVLGTHFNIMGYDDEAEVKTTLAEGIVQVTHQGNAVLLSPAKQAILKKKDQSLAVSNADVAKALAWKNGMIEFDGDDLPYILRQLGRWYDVEVSFVGAAPKATYQGAIRRQSPLSKVLEILKVAGVRYKMEGKRLIVTGG